MTGESSPLGAVVAAVAGGLGFAVAQFLPPSWTMKLFVAGIGATLLAGVVLASSSSDTRPLASGAKALSWLVLGTSRPNAPVAKGRLLSGFLCAALLTMGVAAGVIWRTQG